jgi:hypothetical protein
VHPIERLRYVARAGWAGPGALGAEAAYALADLAEHEPAAMLPACRRLLERNPACGPLWWVAARLCSAGDPAAEAVRCAEELEDDPTAALLEAALPADARVVHHGGIAEATSADVVLVETDALGPGGMVLDPDDRGLLDAARACEADIWVMAGAGRVLPLRLWQALVDRLEHPATTRRPSRSVFDDFEPRRVVVAELRGVTRVAGPFGVRGVAEALAQAGCPEPPELTAHW